MADGSSTMTGKKPKLLIDVILIVAARVAGALSGLLVTMALSRTMGASAMGEVSVAISLAMVLALACTTNIEAGGVRFIVKDLAEGRNQSVQGFLWFTRRYVIGVSTVVVLGGFAWEYWMSGNGLSAPIFVAVLSAPLLGWMRLNAGYAMGFSRPVLAALPRTLFRPLLFLIAIALWVRLGGSPTPSIAMLLFLASLIAVLTAQQMLLRGQFSAISTETTSHSRDLSQRRDWVRIGLTMGLNVLYIEYSIYVTVLAASFVLPKADLAMLDVTLRIMAVLKFGLTAVNQVFMPKLSAAMARGNEKALLRWLALSGLMKVAALVVGLGFVFLFGNWGLSLFGTEFAGAYPLLLVVMLDPILIALFGPGSHIVGFSKRPYALLPVLAMSLFVLVAGTVILGQFYGVIGVGIAVILARAIWVIWLAAYSWFQFRIDPTLLSIPRWFLSRSAG